MLQSIITLCFYCSLCLLYNVQQLRLIKLTSEQQKSLNLMLSEIHPTYILTTYLIDPIQKNTCYIFIENSQSKIIDYYTIFLDDKNSLEFVKNKILQKNLSLNEIFFINFKNITDIHNEITNFEHLLETYNQIRYNNYIKRIIHYFSNFLLKFDSQANNKNKFDNSFYMNSSRATGYICQNLSSFLNLGFELKKKENFKIGNSSNDSITVQNLEFYILDKISNIDNFLLFNAEEKFKQIHYVSKNAYLFCSRHQISTEHIIKYLLELIKNIKNKLDKYTFILCFLKIFSNVINSHCRPRYLKLIIFIFIYLNTQSYEINNKDTLILLYMIVKKRMLEKEKHIIRFKICVLDEIDADMLKIVMIRRYSYFVIFYQDDFFMSLRNLKSFPKYLNYIWLIVKVFIVTIYNIFDVNLY